MIILPDRNIPRAKFLMPVPEKQWREPSLFVPRDGLNNPCRQTRFRINAKTHDGVTLWSGWFDSREDFDAFLWSLVTGALTRERPLWDLPKPMFPGLPLDLVYEFYTYDFRTDGAGSNATYTSPIDWNNNDNHIVCIGAGGAGAIGTTAYGFLGGGGGACSIDNNYVFASPGTSTATYQNGLGMGFWPADGGDTWWGATTFASSTCGAKGGMSGVSTGAYTNSSRTGGPGGAAASGIGDVKKSGGAGGTGNNNTSGWAVFATGGGGAAGPGTNFAGADGGAGVTGVGSTGNWTTNGGTGAGGASGGTYSDPPSGAAHGGAGGNGTDLDSTHGSGGGGGGGNNNSDNGNATGGDGGNYGGGSGGARAVIYTAYSGISRQGLIAVVYTPIISSGFNMPMLGM